jgi:hypothetical protein
MANQVATSKRKTEKATTVVYVYAISPVRKKAMAAPTTGVDGIAAVVPIQLGDVVAWTSEVDATEYGEQLQEHMEDMEWLANAGVRHQQVVAALAEQTDVLPARFGTVFLLRESLLADLKRRKRSIAAALKKVSGTEEWGVKVFSTPEAVAAPTDIRSGRDYLQKKAAVLQQKAETKRDAEIGKLVAALKKASVEWLEPAKKSGGQRNLQWQGSFLVRRTGRAKFNAVLKQFASKWSSKTIECTGPWPPYSFVSSDGR